MTRRTNLASRYWETLTTSPLTEYSLPPRVRAGYSLRRRYLAALLGISLPARSSDTDTDRTQPMRTPRPRHRHRRKWSGYQAVLMFGTFAVVLALAIPLSIIINTSSHGGGAAPPPPTKSTPPTRTSTGPPTSTRIPTTARPGPVDKTLPIMVYNNAKIPGLTQEAANNFKADGWNSLESGDLPQPEVVTSTAYFRQGTTEEAAANALATKFDLRTDIRFPAIETYPPGLIVIITNDYGAK